MNNKPQDVSVWIATSRQTNYPSLDKDLDVDTVIVGGGIAGISIAYELSARGQRVALIEKAKLVEATTGNTTAKVTSLHGLVYQRLLKNFTEDGARLYGEASQDAIDRIEELVSLHSIDCDFLRLPAYTYAQSAEDTDNIKQEVEAAQSLGLPASFADTVPLPYQTYGGIKFDNQAQFHVRKYLLGLTDQIIANGGLVFENTEAQDITPQGEKRLLVTENGTITANNVVVATHEPFYDPDGDYEDLFSFKDYAIGVLVDDETPQGEFFSTGDEPHSIRYQPTDDGDVLILGGKSEAEMEAETPEEAYRLTREDYDDKFSIRDVLYQWYTSDLGTDDGASYIGLLSSGDAHVYVATGFNGWGMTNGAVAGMILADRITGQDNAWSEFFDKFTRSNYLR